MVLSQNRCNVLLLVLGKTFSVLWALCFITMGIYGPYIGISMLASGVENLLPGIMILILGGSAFVAVFHEFLDHRFRIDRYFIAESDKRVEKTDYKKADPSEVLTVRIYQTSEGCCWRLEQNNLENIDIIIDLGFFIGTRSEIVNHVAILNALDEPTF